MSKDVEKASKTRSFFVVLSTLAALAGLIRLIIKIANDDTREN